MRQTLKEWDLYEIDQDGNIYKKSTGNKLTSGKYVHLDTCYRRKVLVANNLIENPNNYKHVVQIDGDKDNYHPSNLMWVETIYGNPIFDKKNRPFCAI